MLGALWWACAESSGFGFAGWADLGCTAAAFSSAELWEDSCPVPWRQAACCCKRVSLALSSPRLMAGMRKSLEELECSEVVLEREARSRARDSLMASASQADCLLEGRPLVEVAWLDRARAAAESGRGPGPSAVTRAGEAARPLLGLFASLSTQLGTPLRRLLRSWVERLLSGGEGSTVSESPPLEPLPRAKAALMAGAVLGRDSRVTHAGVLVCSPSPFTCSWGPCSSDFLRDSVCIL